MSKLVININNKDDLNIFYSKLKYYLLFHNKEVMVINMDNIDEKEQKDLLMIEKAFNIKNKYQRLEYVYQTLCDILDKDIEKNICEFDKNGLCIAQRKGKCPSKINGCCGTCQYIGKKGCTITSLSCKTFYCSYLQKTKKPINYKNIKLYQYFLSIPQKLIIEANFWNTKEDNLKLLYKANIFTWLFHKNKKMKRF
ncbi:MAG: hypothetical protein IJJ63_02910 [Bacilli bacterium]|nr:hypothetical protein [Bacilli bacterium]